MLDQLVDISIVEILLHSFAVSYELLVAVRASSVDVVALVFVVMLEDVENIRLKIVVCLMGAARNTGDA